MNMNLVRITLDIKRCMIYFDIVIISDMWGLLKFSARILSRESFFTRMRLYIYIYHAADYYAAHAAVL